MSLRLFVELRMYRTGELMSQRLVETILFEIGKHRQTNSVVIDGFPAKPEHVFKLPAGSLLVHISCAESLRAQRLDHRAAQASRLWTPGMMSMRDTHLPSVIEAGHKCAQTNDLRLLELDNGTNGIDALNAAAQMIIRHVTPAF